jgi:hypothetical protein
MLALARPVHLDLIRDIIGEGAREGSFSPALALQSDATAAFFEKLRWALRAGRLPQFDSRTQQLIVMRVTGYVFGERLDAPPTGFGIFRDFYQGGNELWLAGMQHDHRGIGLGRAMLAELLDTPSGRATQLARCTTHAPGARRCAHVLKTLGFQTCRIANDEEWLLHRRTPAPIVAMLTRSSLIPHNPRPRQ